MVCGSWVGDGMFLVGVEFEVRYCMAQVQVVRQ